MPAPADIALHILAGIGAAAVLFAAREIISHLISRRPRRRRHP